MFCILYEENESASVKSEYSFLKLQSHKCSAYS